MSSFGRLNSQRGQALLIIVLIMVVALTVGLSVATRSITSLRTSTEEANSAQALSAAEAGLEKSLATGQSISQSFFSNNLNYETSVATVSGTEILLNNGIEVAKDEGIDLWLVDHNCGTDQKSPCFNSRYNGNIKIYFSPAANECDSSIFPAALEIAVLIIFDTNPYITRYAVDPCASRRTLNNFESPFTSSPISISGKQFSYYKELSITDGLIVRIIPVYKDAVIGVTASSPLPSQGSVVTATGTFGSENSKIVRKLTAFQAFPSLPVEYFTFGIFSPSSGQ